MPTKTCKRCGGGFDEGEMAVARKTDFKTYYKNICRKCNSAKVSEWQAKNRQKYNNYKRHHMRRWRLKRLEEHGL